MPPRDSSAKDLVTRLSAGGRVVLPARFRRALGVKPGDELLMKLTDGHLRIQSREQARKRAQDFVARLVPKGVSLSAELIADRRREAARE